MGKPPNMVRAWVALLSVLALGPLTAQELDSAETWIRRWDRDGDQKLDRTELAAALAETAGEEQQAAATATPDAAQPAFIRVSRDAKGDPTSLDTSIVTLNTPDGEVVVDLISAVHVADSQYYKELNRRFGQYDAVLYELVAPEGTRVPRGGGNSRHPVGRMQAGLKNLLDLEFQLEQIDYSPQHLVHADLSPEEFAATMKERGESFWTMLWKMMNHAATQAENEDLPSNTDLFRAIFSPDRPLQLKRIMARQFEDLENQMAALQGPDGSTIITERNKRVVQVLQEQMKLGHDRLAIFYGAGHMPDLAERLQREANLQLGETVWLQAWDLKASR